MLGERLLLSGANEVPSRLMAIFQEEDKYMKVDWVQAIDQVNRVPAAQALPPELSKIAQLNNEDVDALDRFGYRTPVETALTRLRLMGFTPEASRRSMAELCRLRFVEGGEAGDALLKSRPGVPGAPHPMPCEQIVHIGLAAHIKAATRDDFDWNRVDPIDIACSDALGFYDDYYSDDPRYVLAALLHDQERQDVLTMDLSSLLTAGYCSDFESLSSQAIRDMGAMTASTGPIIVITEGKFDAHVMPRALRIVRPDIAGYFNFWDLETTKAAGGTDQVVKNMRSFAAAGVMNRVIGILDNDTAGRQAEKLLASTSLPEHYAVCRLPDLNYAQSYPTLGPSGASADDVAGRACSVEFYFGQDCLLGTDGKPVPVRWKAYIGPMNDYQGELANKPYVQERILEMLRQAEEQEKPLGSEWDPMRRLAETLISLAEPEPE